METRLVPDAPGAWLVYDLGALVLAVPQAFRAVADAVAALPSTARTGVPDVLALLRDAGGAEGAPFAVLDATGAGLHLALRGPATVAAGDQTLTGLGAEPWLERVIPGVAIVRLTVPGGEWTLTLAPATARERDEPPAAPAVSEAPRAPEQPEPAEAAEVAPPPEPPLAPPPLELGEHDGFTVLAGAVATPDDDRTVVVDEIARLRAKRSAGVGSPAPVAPPPGPALSLELPDGSREPIDGVVLVGRAPSAPVDAPASRLLRLEGDGDISRNHARVAVEGGTVVVTDLGSRNGTIVRIPGRPAQKLREGDPTPVLVGTVIDFGGGLELNVRED